MNPSNLPLPALLRVASGAIVSGCMTIWSNWSVSSSMTIVDSERRESVWLDADHWCFVSVQSKIAHLFLGLGGGSCLSLLYG